jgi:hypothetical protein
VKRLPQLTLQEFVRRCLIALIAALAVSAAAAEENDLLKSVECRDALASLQLEEAAIPAAPRASLAPAQREGPAPDARLQSLRRLAARVCLGGRADDSLRTQRFSVPPISVPPVAAVPPTAAVPLMLGSVPSSRPRMPQPVPVEASTVITACDAVGCWASDSTRLHRIGPNLQGPRGLCSVHGGVLLCP